MQIQIILTYSYTVSYILHQLNFIFIFYKFLRTQKTIKTLGTLVVLEGLEQEKYPIYCVTGCRVCQQTHEGTYPAAHEQRPLPRQPQMEIVFMYLSIYFSLLPILHSVSLALFRIQRETTGSCGSRTSMEHFFFPFFFFSAKPFATRACATQK